MTTFLLPYQEPQTRKQNPGGGNALWVLAGLLGVAAVAGSVYWAWRRYQSATTPPAVPTQGDEPVVAQESPFAARGEVIPTGPATQGDGGGIEGNKARARQDFTARFATIDQQLRRFLDEAAQAKGLNAGWQAQGSTMYASAATTPDRGPQAWDQRETWWAATRAFDAAFPELEPYSDISIDEWAKDVNPQYVVDDAWLMGMVMKQAMGMTQAAPALSGSVRPDWTIFV